MYDFFLGYTPSLLGFVPVIRNPAAFTLFILILVFGFRPYSLLLTPYFVGILFLRPFFTLVLYDYFIGTRAAVFHGVVLFASFAVFRDAGGALSSLPIFPR